MRWLETIHFPEKKIENDEGYILVFHAVSQKWLLKKGTALKERTTFDLWRYFTETQDNKRKMCVKS